MTALTKPSNGWLSQPLSRLILRIAMVILIAAVAINFVVTLRGGLNRDDDAYIIMAKAMAAGQPLYKTVVDHSPPGIAFATVPFIWIFGGTSALPARAADVFYALVRVAALIFIMRTFKQSRLAVSVAALLAAMYSQMYDGINPSSISAILAVAGLALGLYALRQQGWLRYAFLLLGGAIFGLGVWTKPSLAVEGLPLLVIFYISQPSGKRFVRDVLAFIAGSVLVSALIVLYFAATGDLYEMLYVTIGMNFGYIGLNPFHLELTGKPQSQLDFITTLFVPQTLPFYAPLVVLAGVSFLWHWRNHRSPLLNAVALWAVIAFIEGALGIALHIRYFSHSIAPLALLAGFSFDERFRTALLRIALIASAPLLLYFFLQPPPPIHPPFVASDYAADKQMLDQTLQKGDCLMTWGWLAPLTYYTDYSACNRITIEGNLMRPELFDIRQMRSWYLEDIFAHRPKLLVRQHVWEFYPELQRLMGYRLIGENFFDNRALEAQYYHLDWTNLHEGNGIINGEIALLAYDVKPQGDLKPGQKVQVTLYWKVLKQPTHDYQGFVQITAADFSGKIAGVDLLPTEPLHPTLTWNRPGEIIIGRTYELSVPRDAKPGDYKLVTGMYGFENSQAVSVPHTDAQGNPLPFIILQSVTVKVE